MEYPFCAGHALCGSGPKIPDFVSWLGRFEVSFTPATTPPRVSQALASAVDAAVADARESPLRKAPKALGPKQWPGL